MSHRGTRENRWLDRLLRAWASKLGPQPAATVSHEALEDVNRAIQGNKRRLAWRKDVWKLKYDALKGWLAVLP